MESYCDSESCTIYLFVSRPVSNFQVSLCHMDFKPSTLGTQKYWDEFYAKEIANFEDNPEDTGECWFSDSGAQERVVSYVEDLVQEWGGKHVSVVDLGSGNGRLLFALENANIAGTFVGIDYSPASIDLASRIAAVEGYSAQFERVDLLTDNWSSDTFDIVLDKGTLDAIALSGQTYDGLSSIEQYASKVKQLVAPGGRLIITSCNFTESELGNLIGLEFESLSYPEFVFGGRRGRTVVTLVFRLGS